MVLKKKYIIIHIIGLSFVATFTLWMTFVFYNTIIYGGVIMYEPNLIIAWSEFIIGILSLIYCIYLFKRFIYEL